MFKLFKNDGIVWVEETNDDAVVENGENEIIKSFDDSYDAVAEAVAMDYYHKAVYDSSLNKISCDMSYLESPNRYGNVYVSTCPDDGIGRDDPETGEIVLCSGYYCQVYSDPDMKYEIDNFCIAEGYEIDNTYESVYSAIKWYLGINDDEPASDITMT